GEAAHPDANIIFGANVDEELSDQVWVTVVATRFDGRPSPPRRSAEPMIRRTKDAGPGRGGRSAERQGELGIDVPQFLPGWPRHPMKGVVAAGHALTAEAGAEVLREGGNAVDAAVCAVLASFAVESPLTGFGAGGYMMVHTPGAGGSAATLIDFFVA